MINTILIAAVTWFLALLMYGLVLRNLTFYHLNRGFLILTLFLGLVLPFIPAPVQSVSIVMPTIVLDPIIIGAERVNAEVIHNIDETPTFSWLMYLYFTVSFVLILRIIVGIIKVYHIDRRGECLEFEGVRVIKSDEVKGPFSFFNTIYIPSQEELAPMVLVHEQAHVREGHTWDKILVGLMESIFWIIPVWPFYRSYIAEVQEFLADEAVLQKNNKKEYSYFLLECTLAGKQHLLTNNFNSLIKKRIFMMLQQKSNKNRRLWYLPILAILFMAGVLVTTACEKIDEKKELVEETKATQNDDTKLNSEILEMIDTITVFDPETLEESVQIVKSEIKVFKKVDQMPLFSTEGCEGLSDLQKCSDNQLVQFIYNKIKYPKEKDKEGTVVLQFVINEAGYAIFPEIVRSIGPAYDQSVLNMFSALQKHQWVPGEHEGKKVAVRYYLPVRFKLEDK